MPRQGLRCDSVKNDSGNKLQRVCADVKKAATACPLDDPSPSFFRDVGARPPLHLVQSAFGFQAHCLGTASEEQNVVGLFRPPESDHHAASHRHLMANEDERSAAEQHHLIPAGLQEPNEPPTPHRAPLLSHCWDTPQSSVWRGFANTCERRLSPPRFG